MPRCVDNFCNGCLNHLDGYSCGDCKYCLDHPQRGGRSKHRKPCVFRWCAAIIVIIIIVIIVIAIIVIITMIFCRCASMKASGVGGRQDVERRGVEGEGVEGEGVGRLRGRVRQAEGGWGRCNSCTGCRNRREGFLCDRC